MKLTGDPRSGATAIVCAVAFVATMLIHMPWLTGPCGTGSDSSSDVVLHVAFSSGWDFGSALVWPFGPYGFIYSRSYHPDTYLFSMLAWAFLAVSLFAALWRLVRAARFGPIQAIIWLATVLFVSTLMPDTVFFALLALLFVTRLDAPAGESWVVEVMLAGAAGLIGLVKFTFFVLAAFIVVVLGLDDLLRRRRFPLALVVYSAVSALLWLLAGQSPWALGPFVRHRIDISHGYTAAMALFGPWIEVIAFCTISLALLALAAATGWNRLRWKGLIRVPLYAGFLFIVFKEGFVRHDEHALISCSVLTLLVLFSFAVDEGASASRARRLGQCLLVTSSLLLMAASLRTHLQIGPGSRIAVEAGAFVNRMRTVIRLARDPGYLLRDHIANLKAIRAEYPLPALSGGADIYPHGQAELIANGLDYSPRPIIQSYMTYNESLASINARHLMTPGAARWIFFRVWPIDTRYPSLDDGLSWPELLSRYRVGEENAEYLLLERRDRALPCRMMERASSELPIGPWIDLPDSGGFPVWAAVDVRLTTLGHLMSLLWKLPPVYLVVTTRDGRETGYTIMPALTRGGFLLSPLVEDHASFAQLATAAGRAGLATKEIARLRVEHGLGGGLFYKSSGQLTCWSFVIPEEENDERE